VLNLSGGSTTQWNAGRDLLCLAALVAGKSNTTPLPLYVCNGLARPADESGETTGHSENIIASAAHSLRGIKTWRIRAPKYRLVGRPTHVVSKQTRLSETTCPATRSTRYRSCLVKLLVVVLPHVGGAVKIWRRSSLFLFSRQAIAVSYEINQFHVQIKQLRPFDVKTSTLDCHHNHGTGPNLSCFLIYF